MYLILLKLQPLELQVKALATWSLGFLPLQNQLFSVPGGLTLREGMSVMEECFNTGCMASFDLVEVNADLVSEEFRREQTLDAAYRVIMAGLGNKRGGNLPLVSKFQPAD